MKPIFFLMVCEVDVRGGGGVIPLGPSSLPSPHFEALLFLKPVLSFVLNP